MGRLNAALRSLAKRGAFSATASRSAVQDTASSSGPPIPEQESVPLPSCEPAAPAAIPNTVEVADTVEPVMVLQMTPEAESVGYDFLVVDTLESLPAPETTEECTPSLPATRNEADMETASDRVADMLEVVLNEPKKEPHALEASPVQCRAEPPLDATDLPLLREPPDAEEHTPSAASPAPTNDTDEGPSETAEAVDREIALPIARDLIEDPEPTAPSVVDVPDIPREGDSEPADEAVEEATSPSQVTVEVATEELAEQTVMLDPINDVPAAALEDTDEDECWSQAETAEQPDGTAETPSSEGEWGEQSLLDAPSEPFDEAGADEENRSLAAEGPAEPPSHEAAPWLEVPAEELANQTIVLDFEDAEPESHPPESEDALQTQLLPTSSAPEDDEAEVTESPSISADQTDEATPHQDSIAQDSQTPGEAPEDEWHGQTLLDASAPFDEANAEVGDGSLTADSFAEPPSHEVAPWLEVPAEELADQTIVLDFEDDDPESHPPESEAEDVCQTQLLPEDVGEDAAESPSISADQAVPCPAEATSPQDPIAQDSNEVISPDEAPEESASWLNQESDSQPTGETPASAFRPVILPWAQLPSGTNRCEPDVESECDEDTNADASRNADHEGDPAPLATESYRPMEAGLDLEAFVPPRAATPDEPSQSSEDAFPSTPLDATSEPQDEHRDRAAGPQPADDEPASLPEEAVADTPEIEGGHLPDDVLADHEVPRVNDCVNDCVNGDHALPSEEDQDTPSADRVEPDSTMATPEELPADTREAIDSDHASDLSGEAAEATLTPETSLAQDHASICKRSPTNYEIHTAERLLQTDFGTRIQHLSEEVCSQLPASQSQLLLLVSLQEDPVRADAAAGLGMFICAQHAGPTLLVDAAANEATCSGNFELQGPGLHDLCTGDPGMPQVIQGTSCDKLRILGHGQTHSPLPSDEVLQRRVAGLSLSWLQQHDLVIVDGGRYDSPFARAFASTAHATFLCVPLGASERDELLRASQSIVGAGGNLRGCITTAPAPVTA